MFCNMEYENYLSEYGKVQIAHSTNCIMLRSFNKRMTTDIAEDILLSYREEMGEEFEMGELKVEQFDAHTWKGDIY